MMEESTKRRMPRGGCRANELKARTANAGRVGWVLDGTVASEGTPANRSCKTPHVDKVPHVDKTPRVAPIMVTDGRTDSRKFKQLLRIVRRAREYSHARRVAVE